MPIVNPTPEAIAQAAAELRHGRLVAFPTETVYGLGAAAQNPEAVALIFEAKQRPRFDPLICHAADVDAAFSMAHRVPGRARVAAERFWPGPLTIVVQKRDSIPDIVTSGAPTVAIRVPDHPVALALLSSFAGPVAAPSANRFAALSPTCADHVQSQLEHAVSLVLDGGPTSVGVESTVLAIPEEGQPRLLRPGGIPLEALESALGAIEVPPPTAYPSASPGRMERHYAPHTPLELLEGGRSGAPGPRVGYLAFKTPPAPGYAAWEVLSPEGQLEEAAHRLFAALRRLDNLGLERIEAEPVPERGLGRAIMDRLRRGQARSEV